MLKIAAAAACIVAASNTTPEKCEQYIAADDNPNNLPDPIIEGHEYHYQYTNDDPVNHRVGDITAGPCPGRHQAPSDPYPFKPAYCGPLPIPVCKTVHAADKWLGEHDHSVVVTTSPAPPSPADDHSEAELVKVAPAEVILAATTQPDPLDPPVKGMCDGHGIGSLLCKAIICLESATNGIYCGSASSEIVTKQALTVAAVTTTPAPPFPAYPGFCGPLKGKVGTLLCKAIFCEITHYCLPKWTQPKKRLLLSQASHTEEQDPYPFSPAYCGPLPIPVCQAVHTVDKWLGEHDHGETELAEASPTTDPYPFNPAYCGPIPIPACKAVHAMEKWVSGVCTPLTCLGSQPVEAALVV